MDALLQSYMPLRVVYKNDYGYLLKSISLFSEFSEEAINKLLKHSVIKHYKKDQFLFFTEDRADFCYIIIEGWIKLFRATREGHESILAILSQAQLFGRSAILVNGLFSYSAQAVADSTLIMIPSDFMLYMAEHPIEFNGFIFQFLEEKFEDTNRNRLEAEHLIQMNSAQRVACFLLRLCKDRGETVTLQFPYEKLLIAGVLGMTPETFSRSLNQLNHWGVEIHNAKVVIHNVTKLKSYVCAHCSATKKECAQSVDDNAQFLYQ